MTTTGQFSTKNPTIKRILKEASELSSNPSPDYHATPLETDLFQWHFTIRGPPPPSPFASGIYHGQITLPPSYPLKPPNFRFLTPSGRFEVNREICLSISGHHEESWQPAWGIRTALVAIRAFMDSEAGGQLGGMSAAEAVRRKLAGESRGWICAGCGGKSNEEVLREQAELCDKEAGEDREKREKEEMLAKEIGFSAKEENKSGDVTASSSASASTSVGQSAPAIPTSGRGADAEEQQQQRQQTSIPAPTPTPTRTAPPPAPQLQQRPPPQQVSHDVWLDRAIIGIAIALVAMVLRQFLE